MKTQEANTTPQAGVSTWVWGLLAAAFAIAVIVAIWYFGLRDNKDNKDNEDPNAPKIPNEPCSTSKGLAGIYQFNEKGKIECMAAKVGTPCRLTPTSDTNLAVMSNTPNGLMCKRVGSVCLTPGVQRGQIGKNGLCNATDTTVLTGADLTAFQIEMQKERPGGIITHR